MILQKLLRPKAKTNNLNNKKTQVQDSACQYREKQEIFYRREEICTASSLQEGYHGWEALDLAGIKTTIDWRPTESRDRVHRGEETLDRVIEQRNRDSTCGRALLLRSISIHHRALDPTRRRVHRRRGGRINSREIRRKSETLVTWLGKEREGEGCARWGSWCSKARRILVGGALVPRDVNCSDSGDSNPTIKIRNSNPTSNLNPRNFKNSYSNSNSTKNSNSNPNASLLVINL